MTNKPKLQILIGLPGSGKSTWHDKQPIKNDTHYVSSDMYLELWAENNDLTYQESFEEYASEAQDQMFRDARNFIDNNSSIIWDQTNLTIKSRLKKLNLFPSEYTLEAIVFEPGLKICIDKCEERRLKTGKRIPLDILNNMYNSYEPPSRHEGFTKITYILE